ncbi:MAG: N-acetylmuramoyl-L-alanine amidase, partial [Phaeobacter italicus]
SPARAVGDDITPTIVVLHDTAGPLEKGSSAAYLQSNDRNVSAHFVIERDGTLTQMVPVDRRANHAGVSEYHGRSGCNDFSIGIELVNPGKMQAHNVSRARAWWGATFDIEDYGIQALRTPQHGYGLWMPHTWEQIDAVVALLAGLFNACGTLTDIVAHWYVSPGRKIDTNPLFPLDQVRSLIFGRADPVDDAVTTQSASTGADEYVQINTPGDALNLRRWPSFNPNVTAQIPHDTVVPVTRTGTFDGRDWLEVFYAGQSGWVVANYTDPITFTGGVR